jgi:hypothetical protein
VTCRGHPRRRLLALPKYHHCEGRR